MRQGRWWHLRFFLMECRFLFHHLEEKAGIQSDPDWQGVASCSLHFGAQRHQRTAEQDQSCCAGWEEEGTPPAGASALPPALASQPQSPVEAGAFLAGLFLLTESTARPTELVDRGASVPRRCPLFPSS